MKHTKSWFAVVLSIYSISSFAADADITSSDGSIPEPAVIGTALIDNGYKGTGVASPATLIALGVESITISDTEFQRISMLKPLIPNTEVDTAPRAVLGLDTKVQLKPSVYPYRAVTLITIGNGRCTGWLAGADTVITAGHCVHRGNGGAWFNLSSYTIYPGHDGTGAPYGKCTAKRLYTTEGWSVGGKTDYDYGAIKLNCQVGNSTGWLGFSAPATTKNLPALISGYPGDKPLGQWGTFDSVRKETANWSYYKNDTYAGMSGAPVWYDAGNRVLAFAIHSYAVNNFNRGARINSSVFKNIKTWKNAQ